MISVFRAAHAARGPGSALAAAALLGGCALGAIHQGLADDQARVDRAEQTLAEAQRTQASQAAETQRLKEALQSDRLTLDQLDGLLAQQRARNAQSAAETEELQRAKQELDRKLQDYRRRIAQLQADPAPPSADKLRRIAELKAEIRNQLLLGLH
jgi:septal ring factor EnvC (AmiA/AmiB activator)